MVRLSGIAEFDRCGVGATYLEKGCNVDVEYERVTWKGDIEKESSSVGEFLYDELLHDRDEKRVYLEKQPEMAVRALGQLISILLDKGILDLNDLKSISGCDWGRKADSLVLKKEE